MKTNFIIKKTNLNLTIKTNGKV